ncbi:MAG: LysM peptidoglycan-binding domain-containing protein [Myxococcaceae bacterium]|nr:LysM peptidoglycan-binding domain-containing protein [Myxococcaceae bacterium]
MSDKRIDSQRSSGAPKPRKRLPLVKRNDVANEDKVRVKAGDMLSAIAVREGVKLSTLRKLNPGLFSPYRSPGGEGTPRDFCR